FSYYLAQINSDWAHSIGVGKSLSWPIGMAAKGNPGVAGMINQTEGALGYIGSEYAFASKIPVAYIQNASGKFILPTNNSISAAAQGDIPSDTRLMITNSEVENAYPISCLTWILIYQEQAYRDRSLSQAKALQNFLLWMIGNQAQNLATKVHYAPLSSSLHHRAQERIQSMTYNGKSL
ncbi:MAG: substrate-binding domain-containing protein, partial [Bacteroidales bacterium]